jgi:hypothetical protein
MLTLLIGRPIGKYLCACVVAVDIMRMRSSCGYDTRACIHEFVTTVHTKSVWLLAAGCWLLAAGWLLAAAATAGPLLLNCGVKPVHAWPRQRLLFCPKRTQCSQMTAATRATRG